MFDGIQEGIIVMKGKQLHFMNELSKKLIEILPKINKGNKEIEGLIKGNFTKSEKLFDAKIFYAFDNDVKSSDRKKNKTSSSDS